MQIANQMSVASKGVFGSQLESGIGLDMKPVGLESVIPVNPYLEVRTWCLVKINKNLKAFPFV